MEVWLAPIFGFVGVIVGGLLTLIVGEMLRRTEGHLANVEPLDEVDPLILEAIPPRRRALFVSRLVADQERLGPMARSYLDASLPIFNPTEAGDDTPFIDRLIAALDERGKRGDELNEELAAQLRDLRQA